MTKFVFVNFTTGEVVMTSSTPKRLIVEHDKHNVPYKVVTAAGRKANHLYINGFTYVGEVAGFNVVFSPEKTFTPYGGDLEKDVEPKNDLDLLPKEVQESLHYCYASQGDKIEVCPDPKVEGTFAIRVHKLKFPYDKEEYDKTPIDLIWNKGDFDECEFETWPPVSGDIKFF